MKQGPNQKNYVDLVSRGTEARFDLFISLLFEWQRKINLIAAPASTEQHSFRSLVMKRHILDSIQLASYVATEKTIIDIGSGAGFPGLILSIILDNEIYLVESDKRKSEFLKEAARLLESRAIILTKRMEHIHQKDLPNHLTFTSRACASISTLLEMTKSFHKCADFLLLKGEKAMMELKEAQNSWQFTSQTHPSQTHDHAHIIHIDEIKPHG